MTFIEALVYIRRLIGLKIKRESWHDGQYYFFDGQFIKASIDTGGIQIDDILHADWEVI